MRTEKVPLDESELAYLNVMVTGRLGQLEMALAKGGATAAEKDDIRFRLETLSGKLSRYHFNAIRSRKNAKV